MSAPETPSNTQPHKRPWGWIALAGLLTVAVVALGVYAVNLNSDLDDANAKIDSQQKELDTAQNRGAGVAAAAKVAYDELRGKLGGAQEDASQAVDQASQQLEAAEQAAADAKGSADELKKEVDAARAKAEAAASCAQSFLSAFSGVFESPTVKEGVDAAVAELKTLEPQCAPALGENS